MNPLAADVAFSSHMLRARSQDGVDPLAALDERRHALDLAERFGGPQQIAEACGALCWSETVAFGAPTTALYVQKGLEVGRRTGLYLGRFLRFEALYLMEEGELDAAEERFTEALALDDPGVIADVRIGLGTLMLRRGRFDEGRQHFALVLGGDHVDRVTQLRALAGAAEAERHLHDDRAAAASASRALELTASVDATSDRVLRRYRSRAFNGLGLVRWRAGDETAARECFRGALDLWPEPDASEADVLVALERHQVLRHAPGSAAPSEGSPGLGWAVGFRLLGRHPLTPVHLPASPPSLERVEQLGALRCGDALDESLWPILGERADDAWFVSRVRSLPVGRCVLVDLVPNEAR